MSAFDTANLRELVGGWTLLTLGVGLVGVIVSFSSGRGLGSTRRGYACGRVARIFSATMLALALFIGFIVLPAGTAYSGPVATEVRQTWRYDAYFAALSSLIFSIVFAFDALRLRRARHR